MKPLALVLFALLVLPAGALAKGGHDDVAVKWLTKPGAGQTWRASFELVDPNGNRYITDAARPVVVASSETHEVRAPAAYGDVAGRYVTDVRFPAAGTYEITLEGWDLRNPQRLAKLERAVRIEGSETGRAPLLGLLAIPLVGWLFARRRRRS